MPPSQWTRRRRRHPLDRTVLWLENLCEEHGRFRQIQVPRKLLLRRANVDKGAVLFSLASTVVAPRHQLRGRSARTHISQHWSAPWHQRTTGCSGG